MAAISGAADAFDHGWRYPLDGDDIAAVEMAAQLAGILEADHLKDVKRWIEAVSGCRATTPQ